MDYSLSFLFGVGLALVAVVGSASTSALAIMYMKKQQELEEIREKTRIAQDSELLTSPIKRAFDILLRLRKTGISSTNDINFVIQVLVANKESYLPDFLNSEQGRQIDEETRNWVMETFLQTNKTLQDKKSEETVTANEDEPLFPLKRVISRPLDEIPTGSKTNLNEGPSDDKKRKKKKRTITVEHSAEKIAEEVHENVDFTKHQLAVRTLNELDHDAIHAYLESNFSSWTFDLLDLEELTKGHAMYFAGLFSLQKHGVLEKWKIPLNVAQNWLLLIEREYQPQPYHNSAHGADVLHAVNYLALENKTFQGKLTPDEAFSIIVAALGHDIDHPGVNNAFLVKARDRRALIYSDNSVNENHHCAHVFLVTLATEAYNIFGTLKNEEYEQIRKLVIRFILATDMAKHFQYLTQFKTKCEANTVQDLAQAENRATVLEMAIKCADLSNPSKPSAICKKWVDRVMEEFYSQGDQEKARGLPVSMFMDRLTTNIPKCQIGFIDFLVAPLYDAWANYSKPTDEDGKYKALVDELKYNRSCWVALSENQPVPVHPQDPTLKFGETPTKTAISFLKTPPSLLAGLPKIDASSRGKKQASGGM